MEKGEWIEALKEYRRIDILFQLVRAKIKGNT